jgi:hypothetical protein
MMLSFKPKMGAILAAAGSKKPGFVQEIGPAGPPEFDMKSEMKAGAEMAAQRVIEAIHGRDAKAFMAALRNLDALMDCEEDMSEED